MIRMTRVLAVAATVAVAAAATVNLSNQRGASSSSLPSFPDQASVRSDNYEFIKKVKVLLKERNSFGVPIDDAFVDQSLDFIMAAKFVFHDQPEKFDEFMKLLVDFRSGKTELRVVKEGMMKLFKGRPDLISRFNAILPPGEIPLPLDDE